MTRPRHVAIEIDRIVLDGVVLDAASIEAMRATISAELTEWLSGVHPDALHGTATPRVASPRQTVSSLADGRELGRSVARAVRDAVEGSGGRP